MSTQMLRFRYFIYNLPLASKENYSSASKVVPPNINTPILPNVSRDTPVDRDFMKNEFNNFEQAYKHQQTSDLIRAYFVYRLCRIEFFVKNSKTIMKNFRKICGAKFFNFVMKRTIYSHFVAGEDRNSILPTVKKIRKLGVKSILDYSAEKDIDDSEAKKKVEEGLHEVVQDSSDRPDIATKQFETSIKFANRSVNLISARTYFYESELICERHKDTFMDCIDAVSGTTNNEGFVAIKLTALGRPQLLLQMSDILVTMEKFFNLLTTSSDSDLPPNLRRIDRAQFTRRLKDFGVEIKMNEETEMFTLMDVSGDGEIDLLDWSQLKHMQRNFAKIFNVFNTVTKTYEQVVPPLTEEGMEETRNMLRRIDELASTARSKGVRILIDAEQTYFQPAIRRITIELMRKYNKEFAVIFNTYQCYLKATLNSIITDIHFAEVEDFFFGAKIVRGAYLDQERLRSRDLGYQDPTCETFDATTANYNAVLDHAFSSVKRRPIGKVSFMLGTHNEETILSAIKKMGQNDIKLSNRIVCFGQLYGMCDYISFNLAAQGFSVYKYLPYGPVEEVLPYLSRRAVENGQIMRNLGKDSVMVSNELKRRLLMR